MAAFRSSRKMNSKLNIKEINKNLNSKRPRAIAATRHTVQKTVNNFTRNSPVKTPKSLPCNSNQSTYYYGTQQSLPAKAYLQARDR